jgi:hypothetical protein
MFRSYDYLELTKTETCSGYWIKYSNQCCVRRKPWTCPTACWILSLKHNRPHSPETEGLSSYPSCKHRPSVDLNFWKWDVILMQLLWTKIGQRDLCTCLGLFPARHEYIWHFSSPFHPSARRHDPVIQGNLSISFLTRTYSFPPNDCCKKRRRKGNAQCRKRIKHIHRLFLREGNSGPSSGNSAAKYFAERKATKLSKASIETKLYCSIILHNAYWKISIRFL